jgi:hypothetical protein
MCQIILLIFGIIYAFRIPKVLKSEAPPNVDPNVFATWRAKELGSMYWFIGATWGSLILSIIIGVVYAMVVLGQGGKVDDIMMPVQIINLVLFIGPLIYSVVLSSQATKLKKQLGNTNLPPSYYPRPGQVTLQAPPEAPPPASPAPVQENSLPPKPAAPQMVDEEPVPEPIEETPPTPPNSEVE